jgi:hypothetical protein
VNQAQTAHDPFTERVIAQLGNDDPFFIADNDVFNITCAVDKDGNLTTEVAGKFDEAECQIVGAEFSYRYTSAVKTFQRLDLA